MWAFRGKETDAFKTYKKYREISNELVEEVMSSSHMSADWVKGAAKALGILQGKTMVLEDESEQTAMMDFFLHDYRVDGKTLAQIYAETTPPEDVETQTVLAGWLKGYTALFKVIEALPAEKTIRLENLLNPGESIILMDQNMSKSTIPGLLLFTRVFPYEEFNMSSGNTFAFEEEQEKPLLRKFKSLSNKLKIEDEATRRFVCFFKANRIFGMGVGYC